MQLSAASTQPAAGDNAVVNITAVPLTSVLDRKDDIVNAAHARGSNGGSTTVVETPVDKKSTAVPQEAQPGPVSMADATHLEPGAGVSPAETPDPLTSATHLMFPAHSSLTRLPKPLQL